jgi:(1->4)-alpha-D-glucan 1-alpha-D-glucosylmutase
MRIPLATYRLQLTDEFTLEHARAVVPYLARLGISDLYLSPVFEARPGSPHGYDVTDPTRIRRSLGGAAALRALSATAAEHGLGIILDIVPNHMAASTHNPWWRDVLARGRDSRCARYFDIDWGDDDAAPRRLRLPILGAPLEEVLQQGDIHVDGARGELVYFETRLPLAPGSATEHATEHATDHATEPATDHATEPATDHATEPATDHATGHATGHATLRDILARQHYELAHWRTASEEMSYRRFFDITDLVGVRVEDDDVFRATHELIRSLAADGVITGLRIDHIDGLRDPAGYLRRLREYVRGPDGGPVFTVVEKILEREERLPADWQCEGTTGYEFLNLATGLLLEPGGYQRIDAFYTRISGDAQPFGELVRDKKLLVMSRLFGGELTALARTLAPLTGLPEPDARRAIAELTASMEVYRTYTRDPASDSDDTAAGNVVDETDSQRTPTVDETDRQRTPAVDETDSQRMPAVAETDRQRMPAVDETDRQRILAAADDATRRNPELAHAIAAAARVALLEDPASAAALDWVLRWQQFTGPVMAKGFEDTALYCHNALLAANEVGSDPVRPGMTGPELHDALVQRARTAAHALNTTATHDTKRGEDTRARVAVLSELPDEWRAQLRGWIRRGDAWKAELTEDDETPVPGADVDSLLYQTLLGAWPLDGADADFSERIKAYMAKAVREAKEQTSWRRPDEDFEQALAAYVDRLMDAFSHAADIGSFAHRLAPHGALNSLAQTLLRIAAPGVPDTYQGTELWSFTLVDPDNRRPVDYELRRRVLDDVAHLCDTPDADAVRGLLTDWHDGRIKLLLTSLALRCRARHRQAFETGACTPLPAEGPRADHVFTFARAADRDACIVAVPRWTTRLAPESTLPTGHAVWQDTKLPLPAPLRGPWRNALTGETHEVGEELDLGRVFAAIPLALLERS